MMGSDVEFFLKHPTTGKVVPVCGKIGGEKGRPIKIDGIFSALEDGAALELNYEPTDNWKTFSNNLTASTKIIKNFTGFGVWDSPEAEFDDLSQYKQANEIGCQPDFWAYSDTPEEARPIPDITQFGNTRFAGGHIHLSYDLAGEIPAWVVARFFDALVTVPVLWQARRNIGEEIPLKLLGGRRKEFYGLPGLHRPKPYGLEYRTLSNYFAFSSFISNELAYRTKLLGDLLVQENMQWFNETYLATNWDLVRTSITELDHNKMYTVINTVRAPGGDY